MDIGGIIHFSPKYAFRDLDLKNDEQLMDAFQDRVRECLLKPAEVLNGCRLAFATGVLCSVTIDYLGWLAFGGKPTCRMVMFLHEYSTGLLKDPELTTKFCDDFRNGLVHQGGVKSGSHFSYDVPELVICEDDVMAVNPELLLRDVRLSFESYVRALTEDATKRARLKVLLDHYHSEDFRLARRL